MPLLGAHQVNESASSNGAIATARPRDMTKQKGSTPTGKMMQEKKILNNHNDTNISETFHAKAAIDPKTLSKFENYLR